MIMLDKSSEHPDIQAQELDWTDALDESRRPAIQSLLDEASAELVIGADIVSTGSPKYFTVCLKSQVFDPSVIPALVATLQMALEGSNKYALIALTVRNNDTVAEFLRTAGKYLARHIPLASILYSHRGFDGYQGHTFLL